MSVATALEALQTSIDNAKTAVVTKGGTTTSTGAASLADEIITIPSSGNALKFV